MSSIKIYKNPARKNPQPFQRPVPFYQEMGIEPEESPFNRSTGQRVPVKSAAAKSALTGLQGLPNDNPRATRPLMRQPYAETTPSPLGRGRGPLPNVGNNVEQTWSAVDGELIDDLQLDPNQPMIDNNDIVDPPSWEASEEQLEVVETVPEQADIQLLGPLLSSLEEDDYVLLMDNIVFCSGPMEEVQEQARQLIFGDHPAFKDAPVPVDTLMVLRKVKIKLGLFLE
jgi:hypothetical protein